MCSPTVDNRVSARRVFFSEFGCNGCCSGIELPVDCMYDLDAGVMGFFGGGHSGRSLGEVFDSDVHVPCFAALDGGWLLQITWRFPRSAA